MNYDKEILELFRRAATDREHGAGEIEETLVHRLLDLGATLHLQSLHHGLKILADGQPAMANLRAMAAWMAAVESPASCVSRLERRAAVLAKLPERLTANAWSRIQSTERVVTLSRSSAVAAVVEGAWDRGWRGSVVVLDGTASGHGADQARRLAESGDAISLPDSAAPKCLDVKSVVVLVGGDAVGSRRFVNSAGTTRLLELARDRDVHRVLVADSSKDVPEEVVEEIILRSPIHREIGDREWPVFEAVPLELVSARVTE